MAKNNSFKRYPKERITNLDHLLHNYSKGCIENDGFTKPVNFQMPYPLHDPSSYDGPDIAASILEEKKKFMKKKKYAKSHVKASKAEISKSKLGSAFLPLSILHTYKHGDPDIYFNCEYNFYYTGGCLDYFDHNRSNHLIRPNANNELCIYDLETGDDFQVKYQGNSVFSIRTTDYNGDRILIIREKSKAIALKTISSDVSEIIFQKESPDIPFVDAKLSGFDKSTLGLINADCYLKLYDFRTGKGLTSFHRNLCNCEKDCFAQIEFINQNALMLANRKELKIFDCKSGKVESEFQPELDSCNLICCFQELNNTAFVATRHDFLKYDIRNTKEPYEYCSHMLSSPPCYIDILETQEDIFIALSGQKVDQKVLFGCKSVNKLPAKIPSVLDTFKECHLRKDLLLKRDLEKYLKYTTTGIKLVEKGNTKILYSVNSIGQIFQQKISEEEFSIYEPINNLYNWINKLPKANDELHVTGIVEMSDVHSKLLQKNLNSNEILNIRPNRCNEFLRKFSSIYRKENFCNMASELMSIWEVENDFEMEEEMLHNQVQPNSKVSEWLESQIFDDELQ